MPRFKLDKGLAVLEGSFTQNAAFTEQPYLHHLAQYLSTITVSKLSESSIEDDTERRQKQEKNVSYYTLPVMDTDTARMEDRLAEKPLFDDS